MPGTLVVLFKPGAWPPAEGAPVLGGTDGKSRIVVTAETAGSLRATVFTPDGILETVTVPIELHGDGVAAWAVRWDDEGTVDVLIEGQVVPTAGVDAENFVVTVEEKDVVEETAIGNVGAESACAEWIAWRCNRFGTAVNPSSAQQRPKPLSEQLEDLAGAVAELDALLEPGAPQERIGAIAAIMRALLYWNGSSYKPLLLRLAGRADPPLALPVFAMPELVPTDDSVLNDARVFGRSKMTVSRRLESQKLMDIQEALLTPVQVEQFEPDEAAQMGRPTAALTAKALVHGVASSSGAAHYDEFARTELDWYRQLSLGGSPAIAFMLREFAEVTRALALMVIEAFEAQDV